MKFSKETSKDKYQDKKNTNQQKSISKNSEYYTTFYHKPLNKPGTAADKVRNTTGALMANENINPFSTMANQ